MGCYADGLIQTAVKSDPVTCHMFEYSPQVVVDTNGRIITPGQQSMCPVQIIFLLKEQNAKKINSHRWFFNSICKQLNPEVCMLLDVGTKPTPQSFLRLWRCFEKDASVGGACGEIAAELGGGCLKVLNPLVAAQNFEYKMSNILDKPLESVFGYTFCVFFLMVGSFQSYLVRFQRIDTRLFLVLH
jgi:chitin synthase